MNCAVIITKKCGDHKIFITKIFIYGIFSNFTKIWSYMVCSCWHALYIQDYIAICHTAICAGTTTIEPQGTGRKRGHSDPEGADSEPGKCT